MHASPEFEVRNLRFKLDPSIPRHWVGGSASRTAFFDSLSPFFVVGERFFVNSVNYSALHALRFLLVAAAR